MFVCLSASFFLTPYLFISKSLSLYFHLSLSLSIYSSIYFIEHYPNYIIKNTFKCYLYSSVSISLSDCRFSGYFRKQTVPERSDSMIQSESNCFSFPFGNGRKVYFLSIMNACRHLFAGLPLSC